MQYRALFAIIFSLLLVSCGGDDATNGTDGDDGNSVLVESSAAEDDCSVGGTTLTFGYDTTGDGEIDDVLTTETICEGEDGAPGDEGAPGEDGNSVLTETTPADVADCPNGGTTVTLGYDTTGDGAIDDVLETANVCDGAPGEDGNSVLVESATAAAADCPAEGTTFTFGYDTTGDGSIDQTIDTTTICDGEQGPQGEPGDDLTVEQSASTTCPISGTTWTFGYDTTGDGSIDTVVDTFEICDTNLLDADVLYYNENAGAGDTFLATLQGLETDGTINLTETTSPASEIETGNYDVVIISRSNSSFTAPLETALSDWVNGGGAAILSHYSSGASIFSTFEATTVGTNLSSATFVGPLGRGLGPVAVTNANSWGIYSLDLEPTGSATSGCNWDTGSSCAIIGNGGRTVALGFLMDTISQADADLIIRNSLVQVLK